MKKLAILNRKETKEILKVMKKQWGFDAGLGYAFMKNENDIFVAGRDVFGVDVDRLNINSVGMYFGELKNGSLRLSIEGSQVIGPKAKKNVITLDDGEAKLWLHAQDLEKKTGSIDAEGYVLVKHNNDFMGTGRLKGGKLLNFIPKARKIMSSD